MEIFDGNDSLLKISTYINGPNDKEKAYLLRGNFDKRKNIISIIDFINLKKYVEISTKDRLSINQKFLYASIKGFKEKGYVYILIHIYLMKK